MNNGGTPARIIYEVEWVLDPDIVVDFDAWLPGQVRAVLACGGFLGATIQVPEAAAGEPRRRRVVYELENAAALDHYLENDAPRLQNAAEQRFGTRLRCEQRRFQQREDFVPVALEARACLNCGAPVVAEWCGECGQARDTQLPTLRAVTGDVTHSLLHLDGRVWRTLRTLVCGPGELTRAFIAGRRQSYLPPFRLYLVASILFFALAAVLPDPVPPALDTQGLAADAGGCTIRTGLPLLQALDEPLSRACLQIRADGGRQLLTDFAATAPKLMFVFLPLMAAVALPFYRRPRRLYVEHLVLFLHNHALVFLALAVTQLLDTAALVGGSLAGPLHLGSAGLLLWLVWYLFRSMRVVYGEGRGRTLGKFFALGLLYLLLLGATMVSGLLYSLLQLA
jgi:hypothetical protein